MRSFRNFCARNGLLLAAGVAMLPAAQGQMTPAPDERWNGGLKTAFFGDRHIVESDDVISLQAPKRAEDAAVVPISVRAQIAQTEQRYIKTISLIIDKNPAPLGGVFHFTPKSGSADLALRVRINEYTMVRAIAETNDGALHMSSRFVKASGGCSAPVGTDLDAAMRRLGKIRFRTDTTASLTEPMRVQLAISHPNITGLQMDQVSHLYMPAHFIKEVSVTFNGERVFAAETDISISENPNFGFYFVPRAAGVLYAEAVDTQGAKFTRTHVIDPSPIAASQ